MLQTPCTYEIILILHDFRVSIMNGTPLIIASRYFAYHHVEIIIFQIFILNLLKMTIYTFIFQPKEYASRNRVIFIYQPNYFHFYQRINSNNVK